VGKIKTIGYNTIRGWGKIFVGVNILWGEGIKHGFNIIMQVTEV